MSAKLVVFMRFLDSQMVVYYGDGIDNEPIDRTLAGLSSIYRFVVGVLVMFDAPTKDASSCVYGN